MSIFTYVYLGCTNNESERRQREKPCNHTNKALKNGNQSIYLDCYLGSGQREYKFLNLYLRPGKTREDKEWNKSQMELATAIKSQYIVDIQNGVYGFKDLNRTRKLNFIDFLQRMSDNYAKSGQKACHTLMESAIKRLIRYKGKNINFNQVDKEYLIGFIDYLNHETNDFDTRISDEKREKKPLSDVYKEALFARVMVALNKAEREGIIIKNPGKEIDNRLKPHAKESTRCYLTLKEVKKIIETPYTPDNDVKPAFLFCCFSGLRHSDLLKLTWGEIKQTADGQYQIETMMKKTKHNVAVPLSENALSFLPERGEAKDNDRVFSKLPDQPGNADARKTLIRHAGIDKKVSFHVGRHTFATLTLTYGADLYTVSKLLGHSNIRKTQIYAKIVDENKRKAVNLIPKL